MQKQFITEHWYTKTAGPRANLVGKRGRVRRIWRGKRIWKGTTVNNPRKLEKLYVYVFQFLHHAVVH